MRLWGKPGKAGKQVQPEQVDAGNGGRSTGGNALPGPSIVYGRNPIATTMGQRLFYATSLVSPMVAGRFRAEDQGSPQRRGTTFGSPDLGAQQAFRGLVGAPMLARLGAQSGPSSQPGYPSTNHASSVLTGLANMGMPDVQRIRGL